MTPMAKLKHRKPEAWACPRCGCTHVIRPSYREWGVSNVYSLASGNTRRIRICRVCRQATIRTEEVPVPKGWRVIVVQDDSIEGGSE